MKDYHINVFWSGEDEAYIADIPPPLLLRAGGRQRQQQAYPQAALPARHLSVSLAVHTDLRIRLQSTQTAFSPLRERRGAGGEVS